MKRSATYAQGDTLRLTLTREWGAGLKVCYIGHNPSTATADLEDPTTLAWQHFARINGCGSYVAVNLYPFRSSDPKACRQWYTAWDRRQAWDVRDALMLNQQVVSREAKAADIIVASWGALASDSDWTDAIIEEIQTGEAPWPHIYCLGTTKDGSPKHPMARGRHRVPRALQFQLWRESPA